MREKNLKSKRFFIYVMESLLSFGALVSASALMILNSTFIYRWFIDFYDLTSSVGLSREQLMYNYRRIVLYVQAPWIRELYMPDFVMSEQGRIHFWDVKVIFLLLYGILIVFMIVAMIKRGRVIEMLNRGVNLAAMVFSVVGIFMAIDFSTAFVRFHELFFFNDYWLFNPMTDPVILALPETLFLILGIAVLIVLILMGVVIKVIHGRYKKRMASIK